MVVDKYVSRCLDVGSTPTGSIILKNVDDLNVRTKTKSLEVKFPRAFLCVKSYNRGKKSCEVFLCFKR